MPPPRDQSFPIASAHGAAANLPHEKLNRVIYVCFRGAFHKFLHHRLSAKLNFMESQQNCADGLRSFPGEDSSLCGFPIPIPLDTR